MEGDKREGREKEVWERKKKRSIMKNGRKKEKERHRDREKRESEKV